MPIPDEVTSKSPFRIWMSLKYLALILFILALARPQTSYRQIERNTNGIDIMMILDFSASMNIVDLAERSRIEVAKDTMENFIKGRQNDRIGFVMFSGEPLTLSPPTLDYGLLLKALRQASIGVLKDGTAIGDGLALAIGHLKSSKAKSKVIILLTDGDNNLGQIDPATAGELAQGFGIRVYTIAVGREGRVNIPIKRRSLLGGEVVTYQQVENALNPELLKLIAKETQGKFYRVTDESTLEKVFREINQLEKSEVKAKEKVRYDENFQFPLRVGLVLLVLVQLLERLAWRFLP
jgi:Ca-activated chloride channel family protein